MTSETRAGRHPADDPYGVLGVPPGASPAEIARAFRRLARTSHPDVAGPGAAERYRRIRAAYERLTDPARREDRTDTGTAGSDTAGGDTAGTGKPGVTGKRIPVRVRSAAPRRGRDLTVRVRVSLGELITGTTRTLILDPDDGMAGETTIRLPAGAAPGTRLRVPARGTLGRHGGAPGDLVVTVDLDPHPDFTVDGRNLRTRLTVGFPQATLGADLPLTVPGHGTVDLTVPPGTTSGSLLRVPGAGLPATDRHPAGDLIAEIVLHVPTDLTPEAWQAIADLDHLLPHPEGDTS